MDTGKTKRKGGHINKMKRETQMAFESKTRNYIFIF